MEDVRAQAIRRQIRLLREDQGLVEEDDRLVDARLRVPDDADLEDDLGAIGVREPGGHDQGRSLLERHHRVIEISHANPRPRLGEEEAK